MTVPKSAPVHFAKSHAQLNPRQAVDYNCLVTDFYQWMLTDGKDGKHGTRDPLAEDTAENYLKRLDQIFRFLWQRIDGYTSEISQANADVVVNLLRDDEFTQESGEAYSNSSKRKFVNTLEKYHEWQALEYDRKEWEPEIQFKDGESTCPDIFSNPEWKALRESALEYGSIPSYNSVSPEERDRVKAMLAQRLEIPKEEVTRSRWKQVNTSWEIPSLLWVSMDAGLRPCEVARIKTSWIRGEKKAIYIPKEFSAKNDSDWEVAIKKRTAIALQRWLAERASLEKYDKQSLIWLNREGNPHSSRTLNHLLGNLLDEADIDTTNRKIVWYSIRHTVGTKMAEKANLAEVREQLRHKSLDATTQYLHPSTESRRETLESI